MSEANSEKVVLGKVTGVYGVKGWIKVHSYSRPREDIGRYGTWLIGDGGQWQSYSLKTCKAQGRTLVAKLKGLDDRTAAEALIRKSIAVPAEQLPELEEGEYYWRDLVGLRVVTREGVDLGKVKQMMETGANDVLVVQGERERLIPFVLGQAVQEVDLEAQVITVDWDPEF